MTSARVLALEATHGTHEFQALRLQLLQKVADQGFTTVAWEEDFGSVALVDAWLQGGPGTAVEAARLFDYGLNRTRDTVDLLTWARAHNDQHPAGEDIRFVGIDAARPPPPGACARLAGRPEPGCVRPDRAAGALHR